MPFIRLDFPPGVFKNGTLYEARGRWFDTNLVRWVDGTLQPVGGWQKVQAAASDIDLSDITMLSLPGESGDYASVPDSAALDITGDLDLRAAVVLDDWVSGSSSAFIDKVSGTNGGYQFGINSTGELYLSYGDGSSTFTDAATTAVSASDGELLLVRATLDVDDGSGNRVTTFYTKSSTPESAADDLVDDTGWSQLGSAVTTASTITLGTNSEDVELGSRSGGTGRIWAGDYYAALVLSGIAGTAQLDADFTKQFVGDTSFTEDSSNSAMVTINQSGDPQAEIVLDKDVDISVLGMFAWRDKGGQPWLVMGSPARCWAFTEGALTEITPASFTEGQEDATASGEAYGDGAYGIGAYGAGDPSQTTITPAQSWQLDNFGEVLVTVARSDGQLLSWDLDTSNNLSVVANAPTNNEAVVVTPERFLVALGAGGDGRKVQWADQESMTTWTPTATNQAGDFILPGPGQILLGKRARGETLIWTTSDLFAMRYIAGQLVYSFQQVGSDCGPISSRAVAMVDGTRAFWMGQESFYVYNGFAQPISSEVSDYVYNDMNRLQSSKIHAVPMPEFGAVWWYYCSSGSSDIDRYVVYNYVDDHWAVGELNRTAGVPRGVFQYPMAADKTGAIYDHERGSTYLDTNGSGLTPFAESGPFEVAQGNRLAVVQELIPDEKTLGDVQMKIFTRLYPTADETEHGPFTMTNPTSVRMTGRQVRVRAEQVSTGWRLGDVRLDVEPGSRR